MSTFREIDERLLQLVDEEGEILDLQEFERLQMEREQKAQGMALWILDLRDEQTALRNEISRLQTRLRRAVCKEERLENYLAAVLDGGKLKTDRVSVSYRTTKAVEIYNEDEIRELAEKDERFRNVLLVQEPTVSRTEIKRLIEGGTEVPGAALVVRISLQVR